jgi:DNA-directed RNA polymerase subunit beta'
MLAPYNFLSPATGEPIIMPSQDMVLGCYYLTADNPARQMRRPVYFSSLDDCLAAYEQKKIPLHAYIWVRFNGDVDDESIKVASSELPDSSVVSVFPSRVLKTDKDHTLLVQYILTTPGRILLNKVLQDALCFSN